jgi:Dyp-type peroxidase family
MTLSHNSLPVREAPASLPRPNKGIDLSHPDVLDPEQNPFPEPKLAVDQIQGNILPGFLKDFETLLFLRIDDDDVSACKAWLKEIIPLIATADEVLLFNRLFKAIRFRRGKRSNAVKATWVNIAFSYDALKRLTKDTDGDLTKKDFTDQAFRDGLAKRSELLGDPTDEKAEGHPNNWVIGGPHNEADIVLIIQSDDREDLLDQVEQIEDTIYALRRDGKRVSSGVHVLCKEHGVNPPGTLAGHEHFGFLDNVSQPGVRGVVSDDPTNVLTPRQNPREAKDQGKPGQDLLWPGEFVFGYEYQDPDPKKDVSEPSDDQTRTVIRETDTDAAGKTVTREIVIHQGKRSDAGPTWAENGSFLVFRRLRQDVGAFHSFLKEQAKKLHLEDPAFVGAKVVGRWPSGAPILRSEKDDNPALGNNDCANNDFEFFKRDSSLNSPPDQQPPDTAPPVGKDNQCVGPRKFTPSPGDRTETICPAFGHIRKAYPRDDITPAGKGQAPGDDSKESDLSEQATQTHRVLRRGLPYGPVSQSTFNAPVSDDVDRGLLFICYQTSIEGQFEFATRNWVNERDFKEKGVGFDLVIGQNNKPDENRVRKAKILLDSSQDPIELEASQDWVIPTGGGYFFAPSIEALKSTLS